MDYRQQTIFWGIYFTHSDPSMLWPPNGHCRAVSPEWANLECYRWNGSRANPILRIEASTL